MHGMHDYEIRSFSLVVCRYRKVVAEKKKRGKRHWVLNEIRLFELGIYTCLWLILQSYVILLPTDNPHILLNG